MSFWRRSASFLVQDLNEIVEMNKEWEREACARFMRNSARSQGFARIPISMETTLGSRRSLCLAMGTWFPIDDAPEMLDDGDDEWGRQR